MRDCSHNSGRQKQRRRMLLASGRSLLLLAILCVLPLPGCVCDGGTSVHKVCFSPDGKTVAYVRESSARMGHLLVLVVGWSSQHICWCPADSPRNVRKISLHDRPWVMAWAKGGPDHETAEALLFSTDSRYLAVATNRRIIVVEPATGRHWPIEVMPVPDSIHWIGPRELGWCERKSTGYDRPVVWRVLSSHIPPVAEAVQRYRISGGPDMLVQWSPDGRYVILGSVILPPNLCVLLDLQTGQTRDLTLPSAAFCGAGWRRDSKAVALFFQRLEPQPEPSMSIVLTPSRITMVSLNLASGQTRKRESDKGEHLDDIFSYRPAPLWTRDNRHVVLSSASDLDYCMLIDPDTGKEASPLPNIHSCPKIEGDGPARVIHPSAVPGWLCFRPRYGLRVTTDYEAERFFPITHYRSFAISPDGRRVAVEADGGKVQVHPLPPAALKKIRKKQKPPATGP